MTDDGRLFGKIDAPSDGAPTARRWLAYPAHWRRGSRSRRRRGCVGDTGAAVVGAGADGVALGAAAAGAAGASGVGVATGGGDAASWRRGRRGWRNHRSGRWRGRGVAAAGAAALATVATERVTGPQAGSAASTAAGVRAQLGVGAARAGGRRRRRQLPQAQPVLPQGPAVA